MYTIVYILIVFSAGSYDVMEVSLGDHDLLFMETSETRHSIVSVHYPPKFNITDYYVPGISSLALLEISPSVNIDDYKQLICLPEDHEEVKNGDTCFSAGWRFAQESYQYDDGYFDYHS